MTKIVFTLRIIAQTVEVFGTWDDYICSDGGRVANSCNGLICGECHEDVDQEQ